MVIWLVFLVVGSGTFLMRTAPLWLGARVGWPRTFQNLLVNVTPAALGALLAPAILAVGERRIPWPWHNLALLAILPAFVVHLWRRRLLLTVIVGIAAYWGLEALWQR